MTRANRSQQECRQWVESRPLGCGANSGRAGAGNPPPDLPWGSMASPPAKRPPMAGGFLLAVSIVGGVIIGGLMGQPSIGFLVGLGVGTLLAALLWLVDRR